MTEAGKNEITMNESLLKYLAQDSRILLAYLFGSRAQGCQGAMSDYDIAVLVEDKVPYEFKYRLAHELSGILGASSVDVIILNNASIELSYNVILTGQLLYQRSVFHRVEFESVRMSKYFDYLPVLRRQQREILEESDYERGIQRHRETFGKTERVLAELRAFQRKRD